MDNSQDDKEISILSTADVDRLYEKFRERLRSSPFETQQQKDDLVKAEVERIMTAVNRKKKMKELGIYLVSKIQDL